MREGRRYKTSGGTVSDRGTRARPPAGKKVRVGGGVTQGVERPAAETKGRPPPRRLPSQGGGRGGMGETLGTGYEWTVAGSAEESVPKGDP